MGEFKCLERMKNNEAILDCFQDFSSLFNTFFPLHLEKCKIFLNKGDYDNAVDYIKSKVSVKHFEIFRVLSFCSLINDGDFPSAIDNLDKCWQLMLTQEPKNPELYYFNAKLFSRICDRKPEILKRCEIMIDKALEFSPDNQTYLVEKAYYRQLNGDINTALSIYTKASEIPDLNNTNNKDSTYGIIYCKILNTRYKEALDDIDFIEDIDKSIGVDSHPRVYFYEAIAKHRMGMSFEKEVSPLIIKSRNLHVTLARTKSYTKYEYLINTDFDFLYEMAKSKFNYLN